MADLVASSELRVNSEYSICSMWWYLPDEITGRIFFKGVLSLVYFIDESVFIAVFLSDLVASSELKVNSGELICSMWSYLSDEITGRIF